MSNIPAELKYVASHEWLRLEADGSVTVGITEHAQELLGDIVFVELPKVGANLAAEEQAGVVESVKAASDVYAPIAGEVLEVNAELEAAPELANSEPMALAGSSRSSRPMPQIWTACWMPLATPRKSAPDCTLSKPRDAYHRGLFQFQNPLNICWANRPGAIRR
jgi:glycine cleavage system H protein